MFLSFLIRVKESLYSHFPSFFLSLSTHFTSWKIKSKKWNWQWSKEKWSLHIFSSQDFWRSAAKWEILNSEKIPTFLSALFIFVSDLYFFLEWKEFPVTHNKRGALLSYLLYIHSFIHSFSNVHCSGNESLHHLAPRKVACNSPYLDGGGSGCLTWYLYLGPASAMVRVHRVCLSAAGDGVLWCWLCHWSGEEDKRELL